MPTGERQKLITKLVCKVLNEEAQTGVRFEWFINKHNDAQFGTYFPLIDKIFKELKGNRDINQNKRRVFLRCDAYFGGEYNFIFEFDEFQHFSSARLKTFEFYPKDLRTNFSLSDWKQFCCKYKERADKYRRNKVAIDFNFEGGRTAQRAYFDCFRDLLPKNNGLNPTLRISDFEVLDIDSISSENCKRIEKLLTEKGVSLRPFY